MTTLRTNFITNPAANSGATTGWTPSGVTLAATAATITGLSQKYFRATLTNVTAGSYTQRADMLTAVGTAAPGLTYQFSAWVRNVAGPRVTSAVAYCTDSTGSALGSVNLGTETGTTWTQLSGTMVAPAGTSRLLVRIGITSQTSWVIGDFFDFGAVYAGAPGTYFDGNTTPVNNLGYSWTGTANASTSIEQYALPTTFSTGFTDAPCPRVGVTIDGLLAGNTVYNLWRTADGKRRAVRGARNRTTVGSDYIMDYEAPLGRVVTYDVEVVSGTNALKPTYPSTVTVNSATWWIQDPLVPGTAQPLATNKTQGALSLTAAAVKNLEYAAGVTIIPILGSSEPVALMGARQIASNIDFSMFTRTAQATTTLRNLIQQAPILLIRTNGVRNDGVPALAYLASQTPAEQPVTVAFGGTLTAWKLTGNLVAAPTINVLVPIWTYGAVQALWATYQQAQTTLAAKTYLDVLKSPSGV